MRKMLLAVLCLGMVVCMASCGGVKFPTDEQVFADMQNARATHANFYIEEIGTTVYLTDPNYATKYVLDNAISFESTEKPKTKDGIAYIRGTLTLETYGAVDINVRYTIFDDNSCEYKDAKSVK